METAFSAHFGPSAENATDSRKLMEWCHYWTRSWAVHASFLRDGEKAAYHGRHERVVMSYNVDHFFR